MKTKLTAMLLLLSVLTSCGVAVSVESETSETTVELPETEIAEAVPEPEDVPFVYEHVVLIGVDGAGAFFDDTETPRLDEIFANGSVTYTMQASEPSISAQCWGSMLHGVEPELHRLTNSGVAAQAYDPESEFPSVFRVIRENDPDAALASFCTWNPINVGIIEDNLGVHKDTAGDDAKLCDKICDYLGETVPAFLFVQFDNVDGAGHSSGYGNAAHLAQITTTDGYVDAIYNIYEEKNLLDTTLFLVTADHGGTPGGSHGGDSEAERNVMFAAAGKTVQAGGAAEEMLIRDSASVVLHALGYEQPESWTSVVPSGMFEGVTAAERKVYTIEYAYGHRTHESVPTPEANVTTVLGDRVTAYFPFDGDAKDTVGTYTTKSVGKLYYEEGYYGQAARFDDGFVNLKTPEFGTDSFSVALWMNTGGVSGDPCLVSNSNWSNGTNPGFVFSLRETDVKFNAGDGANRMDFEHPLPLDYRDGWVHVILTVDRASNRVGMSYDFGEFVWSDIPASMRASSFDGLRGLNIGQDGTGKYQGLSAVLDDVLLIDGAVTAEDVTALASYYGIE